MTGCEDLTVPDNGVVSYEFTVDQSVATHSCREGFDLVGDQTRTCPDGGVWSGSQPHCDGKIDLVSIKLQTFFKLVS